MNGKKEDFSNYVKGVENICSYMKRGALDFCDLELKYLRQVNNVEGIKAIDGIKSRILRDWGQATDQLKILISSIVNGGYIVPFGNSYANSADRQRKK